ncbi:MULTISPECIES: peptidoglycan D,D-transpeptidase FtsI family protein [Kaistia]|uniref:Penicillin-binding protein 2 n=1 Tax=Kaistia nematophila TaxID=2994654 RepID=A0A9X3E0T6_9HYPH|nr:penicillin-binding protein 2 [Kaistia nematophila]MBN9024570.1 penicillin-binding protein 2 [Hyphomicrobiales bacterium]MBN9057662.1 penicillin-binding protein 2 [Hyphomicrobiales bacterium]MCX5569475.1 penicillin-binding protein 2 [Kaistia nematophila]
MTMTLTDRPGMFSPANGGRHVALKGASKARHDQTRSRIALTMVAFMLVYGVIGGRLVMLGMSDQAGSAARGSAAQAVATARPNIVDRNGEILATDIKTASLFAEPNKIVDPDEATELITSVLPDLDAAQLRKKLSTQAGFVWVKREITPKQQSEIHNLGIPGVGFLTENRRFYPGGPAAAHIVGLVNIDNQGIAGIEKAIDERGLGDLHGAGFAMKGADMQPVKLSIDMRVQHILRDELVGAMQRYQSVAAMGVILNAKTGEVMAMASLPDFDPNTPTDANKPDRLNRLTAGTFELGSVFKSFTFAMALDSGRVKMTDSIDARFPIHVGRNVIRDFHAKARFLTVPEIFQYSSNIGTAKMALAVGQEEQQAYLKKFGLSTRLKTDLPEVATPQVPKRWSQATQLTVSFGHGIAITPMQAAVADAALVNGGHLLTPTFFPRTQEEAMADSTQMVSKKTSDEMRWLFRFNAVKGSGRNADVPGYVVGGKTGTAEKIANGRYVEGHYLNSFLSAFPMDDPEYVMLISIDDPKPEKPGLPALAAWNAANVSSNVIRRAAAILGVQPRSENESHPDAMLVSY